jgi:Protein of unknown function (DUF3592)
MSTAISVLVLLAVAIYFGFRVGFWRAWRQAGSATSGTKRHRAGWLFCVVGSLSLLVALGSWIYLSHFIHVAMHATGIVIEMREHTADNGDISYAPTFRFRDAAGVQHTVSSAVSESPPAYHVGDKVPVLYISSDPQSARIDSFWQIWALPILTAIGGGIFLLIGLIVVSWPKIVGRLRE